MAVNLTSIHGRRLGLTPNNDLVSNGRIIAPGPRNPAVNVTLMDDFIGDVIEDAWSGAGGSDTQALAPAINAQIGGVVRLTSGDVGSADDAADASVLTHALNWQAENGGLVFETRLKTSSIATNTIFCGFTDVLATTTVEVPIQSAGAANTITTNATDAVGFFFDTAMTDDNWWIAGVANGTDATHVDTDVPPVADTFQTFRIEVDAAGNADFFLDGALVGTVEDAVTADVALTPVVTVMARTTTSHTVDVDYVYCSMTRV
jgi:hypothetical protein